MSVFKRVFTLVLASSSMLTAVSYTGQVQNNKVRLRLSPSLSSEVLEEVNKGELLAVVGEVDDFLEVEPPEEFACYVYASYIEEGKSIASNVNVRLYPAIDAPVLAQLNEGDLVTVIPDTAHRGWIKVAPPKKVKFYVAREFVKEVGGKHYIETQRQRTKEVQALLDKAEKTHDSEFTKPFMQIVLHKVLDPLKEIVNDYKDFPDQMNRAVVLLHKYRQDYLQLKVQFLENQQQSAAVLVEPFNHSLIPQKEEAPAQVDVVQSFIPKSHFKDQEEEIYLRWSVENPGLNRESYKNSELKKAIELQGVLEPFPRHVKNQPGDYILVHPINKLPIAYVYSTMVPLKEWEGQEVTVVVTKRPHNHFPFPAYHVWNIK